MDTDVAPKPRSLIATLERLTKTDLRYLVSSGSWIVLGQGVSTATSFIIAVAFANLLPVATYGAYKYLLSIASFFAIFTLPGMVTAVTRAAAQGKGSTMHSALRLRILSSLIGSSAAVISGGYYLIQGNFELGVGLLVIALTLPFFDTFTIYNAYLSGRQMFRSLTLLHVLAQIVSMLCVLAALFYTDRITIILAAYFVPLAAIRLGIYLTIARSVPQGTPDADTLRYGSHLSAMGILGIASQTVDKWLLWHFLGPIELAMYAFAIGIPEQLKGPMKGVGDLALPKFSERSHSDMQRSLKVLWYRTALYGVALLVIALSYIALAPTIFSFFFPQYVSSVLYSQIFALSLISGITVVPQAALAAHRKTAEQYAINSVQPVLQIILFLVLIPAYGVLGAVTALLLTRVLVTIFTLVLTARAFRI